MAVSSEIQLAEGSLSSALVANELPGTQLLWVEDEEFPADLPQDYDRMLQSASYSSPRRIAGLVAVATTLLVLMLSLLAYNLPKSLPSVLASPSSASK